MSVTALGAVDALLEFDTGTTRRAIGVLSEREREVLAEMATGLSNAAIAARLHINCKTLETHARAIFVKLGIELDSTLNRRVVAVLAWLDTGMPRSSGQTMS